MGMVAWGKLSHWTTLPQLSLRQPDDLGWSLR